MEDTDYSSSINNNVSNGDVSQDDVYNDSEAIPKYPITEECINSPRVIHEEHVFAVTLRDAIWQSKLDLGQVMPDYLLEEFESGMLVPYQVHNDPLHGRGLYATEDVPAHTKVWDGEVQDWYSIEEFEAFLQYLPPQLQCDVIMWAYPALGSDTEVLMAMDQGSYMNDGGTKGNGSSINASDTTALRLIQAGEEMVEDYSTYVDMDGRVQWFHQLRAKVFGEGAYTQQGAPPLKQNDYEQFLRIKTTATVTAVAVDFLFDELDALVDRPLLKDSTSRPQGASIAWSVVMLSFVHLLLAVTFLKRRILVLKSKIN
jgi:hypothetical protein